MLSELKNIRIDDYNYPLPDERIAKFPMEQRDHSKLLCLKGNDISEYHFYDLPSLLPQDTLNKMWIIRRFLSDRTSVEAMEFVKERMDRTRDNEEFLLTMQQD